MLRIYIGFQAIKFYCFPPPRPLPPHFNCFPSTTTTTATTFLLFSLHHHHHHHHHRHHISIVFPPPPPPPPPPHFCCFFFYHHHHHHISIVFPLPPPPPPHFYCFPPPPESPHFQCFPSPRFYKRLNFFWVDPKKKKLEGFVRSFLSITGLRSERQFAPKCSFLASRHLGHCSFRIS